MAAPTEILDEQSLDVDDLPALEQPSFEHLLHLGSLSQDLKERTPQFEPMDSWSTAYAFWCSLIQQWLEFDRPPLICYWDPEAETYRMAPSVRGLHEHPMAGWLSGLYCLLKWDQDSGLAYAVSSFSCSTDQNAAHASYSLSRSEQHLFSLRPHSPQGCPSFIARH